MKKTILALLLAAILVLSCGCSFKFNLGGKDDATTTTENGDIEDFLGAGSVVDDAKEVDTTGMTEYTDGVISIYYPERFAVQAKDQTVSGMHMNLMVADPANGDNINIIAGAGNELSVNAVTEDALKEQLISALVSSYGADKVEINTNSYSNENGKLDYSYEAAISLRGQDFLIGYRQIMVCAGGQLYTITYTWNISDGPRSFDSIFGVSADSLKVL